MEIENCLEHEHFYKLRARSFYVSLPRSVCQKNVKNCQKRVLKSISVCIRVEKHKGRGGAEEEEEGEEAEEEEEGDKEEEDKDEETYKK